MRKIRGALHGLVHFVFACVPGCGQMSQGYMKRGVSQTLIISAMLFVTVFLEMGVLAVLMIPLWLYSFFDSYNLRRQLREGTAPEDAYLFGLSEMDSRRLNQLIGKRHSLIGWILVAVGLYNVYRIFASRILSGLRDLFPWLDWLYGLLVWDAPRILGTVLIIAVGIWFIKGPKVPEDDGPAYTPPREPVTPPKMEPTPWTEAEEQFHQEPEPQAPEVPEAEDPLPVTLTWKSEFNVEKFEQEEAEKKEADHDGQ